MNKSNKTNSPKGFTLIELLVVIAILATLAVAVTLILNPAELVRQGRDSTRLSDLAALNSAVSLYLADQAEAGFEDADTHCTAAISGGDFQSASMTCDTTSASTTVDGNGWVPVDFVDISSGAPLSNLPIDPVNDGEFIYVWGSNASEQYEINANMESTRYGGGDDDVEGGDGGSDDNLYEIGNAPQLTILN